MVGAALLLRLMAGRCLLHVGKLDEAQVRGGRGWVGGSHRLRMRAGACAVGSAMPI